MAADGPRNRALALDSDADVIVIGVDNLADAVKRADKFSTLILDELSLFKSSQTKRFRAARAVRNRVDHAWGLTGTPAPNGLMDLWAQVFLLDFGERLGTTLGAYRNRYFVPGNRLPSGTITEWAIRPGADGRIHALIEDICLSMTSVGRIDLPPVTSNSLEVPLPPAVRRVYKTMKRDLVADLSLLGGSIHSASNAAVVSSKLSQISSGFIYQDDADLVANPTYSTIHKEKIKALREIADSSGSPVLVFYRFRAEEDMILEEFPGAATPRDQNFYEDWDAGRIPMLVAHPASIGHGLNMQHGGHTIVWTSPTWSLEQYQQANKRLARQGQKHPVVVHHLLGENTVDRAVLQRLSGKKSVQDALNDHLESPL